MAREANGYTFATLSAGLDRKVRWFQIREDREAAATTIYVILRVIDNEKTILPHAAQRLREYLGYEGRLFGTQHVSNTRRKPAATRR